MQLDVAILGREYRIACAADEREALLQAVAYLDTRMREIRDSGKVVGLDRIAVMVALNLANELLSLKQNGTALEGDVLRIRELRERVEASLGKGQQLEL